MFNCVRQAVLHVLLCRPLYLVDLLRGGSNTLLASHGADWLTCQQSRIGRSSSLRRPFSSAVPTYQAASPPRVTRRLSDQRETSRNRQSIDGRLAQQTAKEITYRSNVRDKPTATISPEDTNRAQPLRTPLKSSPITPRQISFQDPFPEGGSAGGSAYARRRTSVTESNSGASANRTSQYRNVNLSLGQGRTYNSSPLVPKPVEVSKYDPQHGSDANHGVEGTVSSASTAAPSTVWDELDDLKSRIHRLELTGKLPPTSGAAMSRASDDRPPTATTNATTMSASPQRATAISDPKAEVAGTPSSQRETQPILLTALTKTKGLINPEVFSAIESAANEALAFSSMVGTPGQPGPISSAASTVGFTNGVTDRQLRRKADSICRSLTELCIALADEVGQAKQASQAASQSTPATRETEYLTSPKSTRPIASQRRPITLPESSISINTSPRAPTSLEQRRYTMLSSTALPSPRYTATTATSVETPMAGRKSSLLLARTRRAGTEEAEDSPGRKSSMLLRTRRATTEDAEEPQEGRKTSLLLRTRKIMNDDEDEMRFRTPSRAVTEVNGLRATPRDYSSQTPTSPPDSTPLGSSALPRRRLVPSSLNPRMVAPSTPTAAPGRRFLDRAVTDREPSSLAEKFAEERAQRQISLSQTAMLNRTGSNSRRRDSAIPSLSSPSNAQNGAYR
ncbi:hypothetical protein B0T17DRAFT_529211 [Bombardia bombarda]|uniref:Uncharacterized protein n=1 Tax=Bombardia bombarda TaxID=252184 RepID=A0AA39XCK1_9PEZI|nr:hypothetical protein B0T17DRAFT_529211 [Bombardia bombarda]